MNNRLDIVRFLLENRYADVNATKSLRLCRFTALLCATQVGHTSLGQYLLDAGAHVNYRSPAEYSRAPRALMIAVERYHFELFVLLYRRGAKTDFALLKMAVKYETYSILRFLLNECLITPDQLELEATSSLFSSPQIAPWHKRVEFLRISLEYRQRTGLRKIFSPPLSIYDYQQERQTGDELESIGDDRDRTFIEWIVL